MGTLRSGALGIALLALGVTSASAGGPGDRGSLKDDRPFSWSGFSIGVHAGTVCGSGDQRIITDGLDFIDNAFNRVNLEGAFAGASLARDWQTGNVVFGIVVDISKSDFSGFSIPDGNTGNDGFETKVDWFGTVRGKLGYASGPYLLYATGGLAYGRVKATQGDLESAGTFVLGDRWFVTKGDASWLGCGRRHRRCCGSNLILGVEYLYVDLGEFTMTLPWC